MTDITVHNATVADCDDWNQYVQSKNSTSCFSRYEWSLVLSKTYHLEQTYLIARRNEKICGVLPTYKLATRKKILTLYSIKNAFISDDDYISGILLGKINDGKSNINITSPYSFEIPGYHTENKITLDLRLKKDTDTMWKSLRAKTRNVIRKTHKNGLVLKRGKELLSIFYNIYSERMNKKLLPFLSYQFFLNILEAFPDNMDIYIAEKNGKGVAGILTLYMGDRVSYAYSAYLPGAEQYSAIHFLMWEIMQDSINKNFKTINMGESSKGSGVYNFKIWMGAEPREVYSYKKNFFDDSNKYALLKSAKARMDPLIISCLPKSVRKKILGRRKCYRALI